MGRIIQQLNYSFKKKHSMQPRKPVSESRKPELNFGRSIRDVMAENLIFIYEASVNLAMVRLYARALKGQRARGEKPQKRGVNISLLSALSLRGVLSLINIYGPVDAVTFEAFTVRKLVPNLWKGACVVIDNAKIHFGEMVKTSIENAGATLIYLSPYSPEFSPIENFWSKVKSILIKLKARTYVDLIDAITDAMLQVTQTDISNWFAHCCYCTS